MLIILDCINNNRLKRAVESCQLIDVQEDFSRDISAKGQRSRFMAVRSINSTAGSL